MVTLYLWIITVHFTRVREYLTIFFRFLLSSATISASNKYSTRNFYLKFYYMFPLLLSLVLLYLMLLSCLGQDLEFYKRNLCQHVNMFSRAQNSCNDYVELKKFNFAIGFLYHVRTDQIHVSFHST